MTKEIQLTQGQVALVDDEDYVYLLKRKWYYSGGYAQRHMYIPFKKTILMHREIMNPNSDMEIDHINMNKLDNRKSNLRICTRQENAKNQPSRKNSSSKYKGVTWNKKNNKWQAQIKCDGVSYYLGVFENETDASDAYNKKAKIIFGDKV